MKKLTIRKAREALSHLDDLLGREGEVTITRRGRPVARLLPIEGRRPVPSHEDLRRQMPRVRRPSASLIREERDAR